MVSNRRGIAGQIEHAVAAVVFGENFVSGVAKFEDMATVARQKLEEVAKTVGVDFPIWRKLEQNGAELRFENLY